jgi:4-amino-4-deoxy-L-arabinose transferase-like glycosyltransferase
MLALFVIAYSVRLLYLFQIAPSPLFNYLELDPRYYHDWAIAIAHGNWIGHEVFEQAPLYPYLLAVYFLVFGEDLWLLRIVQTGIGACTCVLTSVLGLRLFGQPVGLIAGLLCAVYGPFFFYEGQVMKEFLTPPLATGALLLLASATPTSPALFGAGALIALAALVRDNFLLLFPVLAGWLLYAGRWRVKAVLPFVLGGSVILLPVAARNYRVGGDIVLTTSGGGEVFYIGNGPYANGAYKPPPWVRPNPIYEHEDFRRRANELTGQELSRGEASRFWWKQGVRWLVADPIRTARLWGRKFQLFWNDYELPDNYSFYTFRQLSPVLAHTLTFGPLVALGWAGIILSAPGWRRLLPIYLAALGYLLSVLIVFNFGRFRLPIVPVLMVFSGYALNALTNVKALWQAGGRDRARLVGAATVLLFAVPFSFAIQSAELQADLVGERLRVVAAYMQSGELEGAERLLRTVIADIVKESGRHGQEQRLPEREQGTVATGQVVLGLAKAHRELANVLNLQQRGSEAVAEFLRGVPEAATEEYRRAANLPARDPWVHISVGSALRSAGESDEGLKAFRRAVQLAPSSVRVRLYLANAYYEQRRPEEALKELESASPTTSGMDPRDLADYHRGVGVILSGLPGRMQEAIPHLEQSLILEVEAPQAPEVRKLLESLRTRGN